LAIEEISVVKLTGYNKRNPGFPELLPRFSPIPALLNAVKEAEMIRNTAVERLEENP